jgi:uncharacterized protein (DUF302 family)
MVVPVALPVAILEGLGPAQAWRSPSPKEQVMDRSSSGFVDVTSHHSVPTTLDRLESLAKSRGLTIFARIDFSGDALRAGLALRPMQMLLFGNPKAGTPLMVASPRVGLDLPLKALAWEDADGTVRVSTNRPDYIERRHGLPHELISNVAGANALIEAAAEP